MIRDVHAAAPGLGQGASVVWKDQGQDIGTRIIALTALVALVAGACSAGTPSAAPPTIGVAGTHGQRRRSIAVGVGLSRR